MTLGMPTFLHMITVVGPPVPPSAEIITKTLQYGQVEGALLPPALIDVLCQTSPGLDALRQLKFVHYAGAPLSKKIDVIISAADDLPETLVNWMFCPEILGFEAVDVWI